MPYLGEGTPKLGFGLMRLPQKDGHPDIEQVKQMVDLFMDAGGTYFDTARAYGESEDAIRQALVERYPRDSFTLATKNAAWLGAKNAEEAKDFLRISLENTGAGYFDYYLLHNLGGERTKVFENYGMFDWTIEQREKGLIKHLGCSIHDNHRTVERILKEHPEFEFVQLQVNYADWDDPIVDARRCLEICAKYGKPVVIMEPVKGGYLANPPEAVERVLKAADPEASCASWAIRFAASQPNVITVLSGMSNVEQMQDNLSYMRDFKPLDEREQQVIAEAQAELAKIDRVPCTGCQYCEHACPTELNIHAYIDAINEYSYYGNLERAKGSYTFATSGKAKASECIECGACEEACPQQIDVMAQMRKAAELFE